MWQSTLGNIPLEVKYTPGDIRVPGDYNGDGKSEMAIYRPSTQQWLINFNTPIQFGKLGDIPVPGNYLNDGKTYSAVYLSGKIILRSGKVIDAGKPSPNTFGNIPAQIRIFFKKVVFLLVIFYVKLPRKRSGFYFY